MTCFEALCYLSFLMNIKHVAHINSPQLLYSPSPYRYCTSTTLPFRCPRSNSLADFQGDKVDEEIDSKKDSHVMWRGTKEDPRSLEGLSTISLYPLLGPHRVPPTAQKQYPDSRLVVWTSMLLPFLPRL